MSISFEGIGEVTATFLKDGNSTVKPGQVVCITGNNTVGLGADGTVPCGVAATVAGDGYVGVQISGLAEVTYSGTAAPTAGWNTLAADGSGGMKVAADGSGGMKVAAASTTTQSSESTSGQTGRPYLVVSVDTTAKTAVIKL